MGLLKSLIARVGLDGSEFDHGAKKVEERAEKMGENVAEGFKEKLAEAFGLVALEEGVRRTIEFGHEMLNLATRTGLSTDELQKFEFAAKHAGSSLDAVVMAVEKLGIAQAKAINDPKVFDALTRLGLTPEQISNLEAAGDNFKIIGEKIKDATVNGELLKDMTAAFGKSSRELIPMFKNGLEESADELARINGLVPNDKIRELADASERMEEAWVGIRSILADVVPTVTGLIGDMMKFLKLTYIALSAGSPKNMTPAQKNFVDHVQFSVLDPYNLHGTDRERTKFGNIPKGEEYKAEAAVDKNFSKDENELKRIARERLRVEEEIDKVRYKNYMDSLTKEEQIKNLRMESAAIENALREGGLDKDTELKLKLLQAKDQEEEIRLGKELNRRHGHHIHTDALARIGGFVGGSAEGALVDIARSQLAIQRQIAHNTSRLTTGGNTSLRDA